MYRKNKVVVSNQQIKTDGRKFFPVEYNWALVRRRLQKWRLVAL